MINFLRTIRLKLFEEGKLKKYLLYAIGEVILVMLGILIALQINNWNNSRIELKAEIKILYELKTDVNYNYHFIKTIRDRLISLLNNSDSLLQLIEYEIPFNNDNYPLNNMGGLLGFLGGHGGLFNATNTSYKYIESYGMGIIKNDSLRIQVTDMFERKFNHIRFREEKYVAFYQNEFDQFVISNFKFSQGDSVSVKVIPIDINVLFHNPKFKNLLIKKRWYEQFRIKHLESILIEIENLLDNIQIEIIRLEKKL